jgi:hypothetical protein
MYSKFSDLALLHPVAVKVGVVFISGVLCTLNIFMFLFSNHYESSELGVNMSDAPVLRIVEYREFSVRSRPSAMPAPTQMVILYLLCPNVSIVMSDCWRRCGTTSTCYVQHVDVYRFI